MVLGQVHDVESEATRDGDSTIAVAVGVEQQQLRAGHERRPDECFRARVVVVAVHDDEPGPHPQQRFARAFVRSLEVWLMSGELDGGTKKGGGERVGREDQYVVTAQLMSLHEAAGGAGIVAVLPSKRETNWYAFERFEACT